MNKCWMIGCGILATLAVFAEQFTLTIGGDGVTCEPAGGSYESGTLVTLTAPGEGFVKWIGNVDQAVESNATLSVTMNANKTLTPLYHRMWIFERDGSNNYGKIREVTLPDEAHTNWLLNVRDVNTGAKTFTLGHRSNSYRGNAFVFDGIDIIGNGKMDLSTRIVDAEGNAWTMTQVYGPSLGMDNALMYAKGNVRANTMTECILPTTLAKLEWNIFDNDPPPDQLPKTLTNVVIVCPSATGYFKNWFFNGQAALKRVTIKCPKVTTLQKCLFQSTDLTDTDVTDWDLSGVEALQEGQTFLNFKGTGIFRLPKVKSICDNAFKDVTTMNGIELGCGNGCSVQTIGANAFGGNFGVKRLVIAGAEGWTLATNSITLNKGLTQLAFAGALPAKLPAGKTYFNGGDVAAKKVCFYVNDMLPGGKAVLAQSRELTAGEADAFKAANPGAWEPVGVIAPEVFGTQYEQFVGVCDLREIGILTPVNAGVYDPRYGDRVEVTATDKYGNQVAPNEIAPGNRVSVRAIPHDGNTFAYWDGLPEDAVTDGAVVTFTAGTVPVTLRARIRHTWRWLAKGTDENPLQYDCISDGVWTLYAREANNSLKTIKLGYADTNYGAYTGVGSGMLDLNGKVIKDGDDGWRIGEIPQQVLRTNDTGKANPTQFNTISDLIVPEHVTFIGNDLMSAGGSVTTETCVLTNAVVYVPEYAGTFDVWMFNGQRKLKTITLYAPKVTRINRGMFNGCSALVADASEWRFDSVEIIESLNINGNTKVTGELRFPSLTNVVLSSALCNFKGTAVELGTKYSPADKAVLSMSTATNCFAGCTNVERLELGAYSAVEFYDDAFNACSALKEVVFHGAPLAGSEIDKILRSAADWAVVMHASGLMGWKVGKPQGLRAASASEPANLPQGVEARNVIGVYETAGGKHAWVVHRASEWDPKGTVIIFR